MYWPFLRTVGEQSGNKQPLVTKASRSPRGSPRALEHVAASTVRMGAGRRRAHREKRARRTWHWTESSASRAVFSVWTQAQYLRQYWPKKRGTPRSDFGPHSTRRPPGLDQCRHQLSGPNVGALAAPASPPRKPSLLDPPIHELRSGNLRSGPPDPLAPGPSRGEPQVRLGHPPVQPHRSRRSYTRLAPSHSMSARRHSRSRESLAALSAHRRRRRASRTSPRGRAVATRSRPLVAIGAGRVLQGMAVVARHWLRLGLGVPGGEAQWHLVWVRCGGRPWPARLLISRNFPQLERSGLCGFPFSRLRSRPRSRF